MPRGRDNFASSTFGTNRLTSATSWRSTSSIVHLKRRRGRESAIALCSERRWLHRSGAWPLAAHLCRELCVGDVVVFRTTLEIPAAVLAASGVLGPVALGPRFHDAMDDVGRIYSGRDNLRRAWAGSLSPPRPG